MKMEVLKKLFFAVIIGAVVMSCMDSTEEYIPPTLEEEMALLDEYIDTLVNRGFDIQMNDLGIYYAIDSIGEGAYPTEGDTCLVKYTGFFISGGVFDSSGDNSFEVVLGENRVIQGWEEGLKEFNKGSKGYLIIPSEFAYGSTGTYGIPPYTTIVFGIEMEDIKYAY